LLDLIDRAVADGWEHRRGCSYLELDEGRAWRWRRRRDADCLGDRKPGSAVHGLRPEEVTAILGLFEAWGEIDRSHRKLAHRGSYIGEVWVSPATVRRVLAAHGLVLKRPRRVRAERRPFPEWADYRRNSIWIYDCTHFAGCPKIAVFAVIDLVTRKWITELVSIEETSTQVQVVFLDALEAEGLLELVEARQDLPARDPFPFDAVVDVLAPVLLAVSDNGPQMTSCSTREFMAMCAIAQHFGRPGTPTDQAWIESPVQPHQGRLAAPRPDQGSRGPAGRARGRPPRVQHGPVARRDRLRHPGRRARRPRPPDPRRSQTRPETRPLGSHHIPSTTESQSQPPEPHRCGLIRSPICGFDSDTPQGHSRRATHTCVYRLTRTSSVTPKAPLSADWRAADVVAGCVRKG
jgi:putative transposase